MEVARLGGVMATALNACGLAPLRKSLVARTACDILNLHTATRSVHKNVQNGLPALLWEVLPQHGTVRYVWRGTPAMSPMVTSAMPVMAVCTALLGTIV